MNFLFALDSTLTLEGGTDERGHPQKL